LLAAVAVTISISVSASLLSSTRYFLIYPHLSRINHPFDFLGGPLLFLYVRALIKKSKLKKQDRLHFLPAILVAIFLIPYYLKSGADKLASLPAVDWYYARSALVLIQFSFYLALIVMMLAQYSRAKAAANCVRKRFCLHQSPAWRRTFRKWKSLAAIHTPAETFMVGTRRSPAMSASGSE
ncbi:MAG TPA: hypothetical protein VKA97_08945, partial [Pyrinomonadaceae bacterium]|nr:hypothetical protein [Pyrinomonadaceae bacterium]